MVVRKIVTWNPEFNPGLAKSKLFVYNSYCVSKYVMKILVKLLAYF